MNHRGASGGSGAAKPKSPAAYKTPFAAPVMSEGRLLTQQVSFFFLSFFPVDDVGILGCTVVVKLRAWHVLYYMHAAHARCVSLGCCVFDYGLMSESDGC